MSPEQLDLARRLVAHPKWRWARGMRAVDTVSGGLVYSLDELAKPGRLMKYMPNITGGGVGGDLIDTRYELLPMLSDYATAAILLRMAMEALHMRWVEWPAETRRTEYEAWTIYLGHTFDKPPKMKWQFATEDEMGPNETMAESEDLGTVAGRALLAAWGE